MRVAGFICHKEAGILRVYIFRFDAFITEVSGDQFGIVILSAGLDCVKVLFGIAFVSF